MWILKNICHILYWVKVLKWYIKPPSFYTTKTFPFNNCVQNCSEQEQIDERRQTHCCFRLYCVFMHRCGASLFWAQSKYTRYALAEQINVCKCMQRCRVVLVLWEQQWYFLSHFLTCRQDSLARSLNSLQSTYWPYWRSIPVPKINTWEQKVQTYVQMERNDVKKQG